MGWQGKDTNLSPRCQGGGTRVFWGPLPLQGVRHRHLRPAAGTHPSGTPFLPTPRGPSEAVPAGGGTSLLLAITVRTGFDAL